MKTTFLSTRIAVLILMLTIVEGISFSQNKELTTNYLTISGMVDKGEDDPLFEATVKLFEKGNLLNTFYTKSDGVFNFKLALNSEYTLEVSKTGYVTKIFSINTKVPSYEKGVWERTFSVTLFVPCEGVDLSQLQSPIFKLVYNEINREFLPEKSYDKIMLAKLQQLYKSNDDCVEEKYQTIVRKADRQFTEKKYPDAKDTYVQALDIRPKDEYVKGRIDEIDKILSSQKNNDKLYNDYIAQADKQFASKSYPISKEFYKRALTVKPDATYPVSQIALIDKIMADKNKQDQDKQSQSAKFQQLLSMGDAALDDDPCGKALKAYRDALAMSPNDPDILQKISVADKKCKEQQAKLAQDKDKQARYDAAIAKADQLYKSATYPDARTAYQDALAIIPTAEYPQKQIDLIDDILKKQNKDLDAKFKALVDQGDKAYDSEKYNDAKGFYQKALELKPNDNYCLSQIKLIDKLLADLQKKDAQSKAIRDAYNKAIADADKLFAAKDYSNARPSYEKASQIIPSEEYPKQKIKEIDSILKAMDKDREQQYKNFISQADKAFDNEDFLNSKDLYQKALGVKPTEQYPKDKIKTIDSILAEQQRLADERKAKLEQYNKAIAEADLAFKKPDYSAAKTGYMKALGILPDEQYPKQKLSEIESILNEMANKLEQDYKAKIQSGDKNFMAKSYTQARQDYQDALKIKPGEEYPTSRISDIDKILADQARLAAEQKAKKEAYDKAITKADNQFKSQQYDLALVSYKEASSYLPEEKYPYTKIDEIGKIKKQLELDKNYKDAIAKADDYYQKKQYESSKTFYNKSLEFKPNDAYALAQIQKIDKAIADQLKLLADQKARQDAYDKAIADGDKNFGLKDYEMSRSSYQTALAIFNDKPYPKQKIDEIDRILKQQQLDKDYRDALDEANQLFTDKTYLEAKTKYQEASKLKPQETFPIEKIKEIDKILAQLDADKQKRLLDEKNYNEAVAKANDLFDKAQYANSKKEYERALTIMPNETYPKQRIAKINEILSMLAKDAKGGEKTGAAKETKIADLKFKSETEKQIYLRELLAKYPAGITCEVYKEKNRTVTRYIIIRENQANDFRQIKYNWGGVDYIRNDKPVTLLYFNTQVKTREGEYFTQTDM
jgi:tetratricopeptide (TPR) repeat protein